MTLCLPTTGSKLNLEFSIPLILSRFSPTFRSRSDANVCQRLVQSVYSSALKLTLQSSLLVYKYVCF